MSWHTHCCRLRRADIQGRLNREDIGRQDIPSTTKRLAQSLVSSLRRLYRDGARSFLVINLPPLDHSPKYSVPGESGIKSQDLIGQSCVLFNQYLKEEVDKWIEEAASADKNVMQFDLESFWRIVLEYPELFGITETSRYQMFIDGKRPNLGRMGYLCVLCRVVVLAPRCRITAAVAEHAVLTPSFHDNQHFSWSAAEYVSPRCPQKHADIIDCSLVTFTASSCATLGRSRARMQHIRLCIRLSNSFHSGDTDDRACRDRGILANWAGRTSR